MKKKKKGFTLIEILSVVIILGILTVIAIPVTSRYIANSRKEAYVAIANKSIDAMRNMSSELEYDFDDPKTVYYVPLSCLGIKNSDRSPYGKFVEAYVIVTVDEDYTTHYYWTGYDEANYGIELAEEGKVTTKEIVEKKNSINQYEFYEQGKDKISKIDGGACKGEPAITYLIDDDMPTCKVRILEDGIREREDDWIKVDEVLKVEIYALRDITSGVKDYGLSTGSIPVYDYKETIDVEPSESEQTVTGYVRDNLLNESTCSVSVKVKLYDAIAPTCTYAGESTTWTNGNRTIAYGCLDDPDGTGCHPDFSGNSITFSTTAQTGIVPAYTIKDNAGNETMCPAKTVNLYIDKVAPTCTSSGDAGSWTAGNRTIYYGCSDSNSGCASGYVGGNIAYTTTTGVATIPAYTIKDNAGNQTVCPARSAGVYVDKTPPVCSPTKTNTGSTGGVTITPNCSDAQSGISSATGTLTGIKANQTITATDIAGNTYSVTVTVASKTQYSRRSCTSCGTTVSWYWGRWGNDSKNTCSYPCGGYRAKKNCSGSGACASNCDYECPSYSTSCTVCNAWGAYSAWGDTVLTASCTAGACTQVQTRVVYY